MTKVDETGVASRIDGAARAAVLVHLYLEIDDRKVFHALSRLDDLRAFATVAQGLADEAEPADGRSRRSDAAD